MQKMKAEVNTASPFESEPLDFYSSDGETRTEIEGSTKLPADFEDMFPLLEYILDALTSVRSVVPDATWNVNLDESEVDWSPDTGFTLPGL